MIGLSPLSTAHPSSFQPTTVRASTRCYPGFTLAMDRSLRFRVYPHALVALFRLAFASAPDHRPLTSRMRSNSPDHNAKGTPSPTPGNPKIRVGLRPLVCTRFQDLFHSPSGVLFTFPSRYYPLSVTDSYLALEDGPPGFSQGFTCPGLLGVRISSPTRISHTGLSPSTVVRSSTVPLCFGSPDDAAPQPPVESPHPGLGFSRFARRYSGNLD